jgi:hypothetical protein
MPDREKVADKWSEREIIIWSLERCACNVPDACSDCCYKELHNDRMDCVTKLTGDTLSLLGTTHVVIWQGDNMYRWYACEACDTSVSLGDKFCRGCGRVLKWDD